MESASFWIAALAVSTVSAIWVHQDGSKRGFDASVWSLIAFFVPLLGVPGYLVVRSTRQTPTVVVNPAVGGRVCRQCDLVNPEDAKFCKGCGNRLAS